MKSYEQRKNELLASHATSDWLKRAVLALHKRDPLDAEYDADALADLMNRRAREETEV